MDRKNPLLVRVVLVLGAASFSTAGLDAASMVSPAAVLATDLGEYSPDNSVENMINQSGLDKPFTSGASDFDEYFTTGAPAFAQANFLNNWQSEVDFSLPLTGFVDFDLGAVWSIDRIAIWNISLNDIKILVSDTSVDSLVEVASFSLPNHLFFPFSYSHDLLDLGATHDVRYLRIEIDSVHLFDPADMFGYAIVGEVVASAVPISAALDGDYNSSGTVDAADYTVWRDNLGANVNIPNDTTPGSIGPEDYDEWKANFGATSGLVAGAAVPDPATWWLAVLGAAAVGHGARRRRALVASFAR
jgi:hypothetical protein